LSSRGPSIVLTGCLAIAGVGDASPALSAPAAARMRWTDATPDAMLDAAAARTVSPATPEAVALASLAVIDALADRAAYGHATAALEAIAATASAGRDVRDEAALTARSIAADKGTDTGAHADEALGVVDAVAILGPFRDTGGGLEAHDGPEAPGASMRDMHARYSWGAYEVAWRAVPRSFATASGIPLDVFVHPRKESCTWVASKITLASAQPVVVRLASTGQVRLMFDGAELGRDTSVHASTHFDRIAARVRAAAGPHLVAAKVCSGAIDDDGDVRVRVTDDAGRWPAGAQASADLDGGAPPTRPAKGGFAVERRTTVLGRGLAAAGVSTDARIAAAVLRTLAGADDLRSPRAPGLLSALVDGTLDPDRLALVAWIAPSGANRGAWYRKAFEATSADAGTRSFVARRLVEQHRDAGLADWAEVALRGAGVDKATDPEATLLTARAEVALGTEALRLRALGRLKAAAAATDAPNAVLGDLLPLATEYTPALGAAVAELLIQRGEADAATVSAMDALGADAVAKAAREAFAGGVDSADDALAVAADVAETGDHDQARSLYEQLARWAPNRGPVWAGLARETGAVEVDAGRDEAILAALRRARELDPGEVRYKAELALRAKAGGPSDANEDESYLVPSQTILARRGAFAPGAADATQVPDVADRQLYWRRAVVMHPDRRVSELVHYAREIVIAPRTEDDLYEDVPAEGDLSEIVRARVHRAAGGTAFPVEEASDDGRLRIKWPELAAGDVVEVAFRSWTAGPVGGRGDPPFVRLDYAGGLSTHPVLYNEVDVETPPDRPIYADVINGKADRREEKDENGRHVVRLVWDHPASVPDEPLAPPASEVMPTVVLSTFKDWSAFRSWYAEAIRGFTEPDAQVRDLAAKLTRGKSTRDTKVEALFDFVADDIRYVNYVSGEWWLPNRPQQLLARREGDCDDKALLLITLLKACGIDADEVMVQTRLTGEPSILRAQGAAVPIFDHGIAHLSGPGGGTYLDATSPQSRLGPLPSMDARAVALRMTGPAAIVELPASSPNDHGVDASWTITLGADGSADIEGQDRASGDDAFWMRTYLTEPGARAQWMEDHLVGTWFTTVQVDKKVDFDGSLPHGGALVKWRARSTGLARKEGAELVLALSPVQTLASRLAPLVKRTLPVWLPPHVAPREELHTFRVVAPKGWTFEALPQGGEAPGGPFGRASLDLSRDPKNPKVVVVKRSVVVDQSVVGVDEYPKWRAWVQRVDALMHKTVRLVPDGSAP
jgi:tetratricopeptide (TPR) repeat protein